MKHSLRLLFTVLFSFFSTTSLFAYDFKVGGIYYNILSNTDLTCEVTDDGSGMGGFYDGNIIIPSTVNYSGKEYVVKKIGNDAFIDCLGVSSIKIPNSVTSIGDGAFFECSNLSSIEIPNSVTSIGGSAFYGCGSLASITIPNSVISIGSFAFSECHGLTSIEIPSGVTSIGETVFSDCNNLQKLVIKNPDPSSIYVAGEIFIPYDSQYDNCVLYVPKGSEDSYRQATMWSNFRNIVGFNTFCVYDGNNTSIDTNDINEAKSSVTAENALTFVVVGDYITSETNWVVKDDAKSIVLTDAEPFYCPSDVTVENMTYKRDYVYDVWQALYVPFSSKCSDWGSDTKIAYLNNIHQYDTDDNGTIDKVTIEFFSLSGSADVKANIPYLIKPEIAENKTYTFSNVTMKATPAEDGSVSCASTTWDYKISGNYQPISSLTSDNYVLIKGGGFGNMTSGSLPPFRIRLKTSPMEYGTRTGEGLDKNVIIQLVVDGVPVSLDAVSPEAMENIFFDLQGRRIKPEDAEGMIIRNGKVVFIK